MKKSIQIIEINTGLVHTEISTLEELLEFLRGEVFQEDFQRRFAVEKLLSRGSTGLSHDLLWKAIVCVKQDDEKKKISLLEYLNRVFLKFFE